MEVLQHKKASAGKLNKMGIDASSSRRRLSLVEDASEMDPQKIKESLDSTFEMLGVGEAVKALLINGMNELTEVTEVVGEQKAELTVAERERKLALQNEAARIRWLLAINPNTPPPVLEHLSRDNHPPLLQRIAENPRAHVTTLIKLSMHSNAEVRASVAENSNLSLKTVWRLARDESPDVRLRMAESYTVPLAVLRVLSEDENPFVAHRAKVTMRRIMDEVSQSE